MAERNETLYNNAERFAEAFYGLAKDGKVAGLTPYDRDLLRQGEDAFIDFYTDAFLKKLDTDYPENGWDDKKADRLNETKPQEGVSYVLYGGDSPEKKHDAAEFTKFHELVKDGKWHDMTAGQLSHWASTKGGYDWSAKGDRDKFWEDLSRFDQEYNRAKIVEEETGDWRGKVAAVAMPSAYESAVRQSLTGNYDDDQIKRQMVTDAVANTLIGSVPAFNSVPGLMGPVVSGGVQGTLELGRQLAKTLNDPELEIDPYAPAISAGAGAGVPSLAMLLQGGLQKGAQGGLRSFGRGFARGARGVDPVQEEKALIKKQVIAQRNDIAKQMREGKAYGYRDEVRLNRTPSEYEAAMESRPVIENLKYLEPHRTFSVLNDAEYGTGKALKVKSSVVDDFADVGDDFMGDVQSPDLGIATYKDAVLGDVMGVHDGKVTGYTMDLNKSPYFNDTPSWMIADPVKKVDGLKTGITKEERKAMLGFQDVVKRDHRAVVNTAKADLESGVVADDDMGLDDFFGVNDFNTVENTAYNIDKKDLDLVRSGANKLRQTYTLAKALRQYDNGTPTVRSAESWEAFKNAFPAKAQEYVETGRGMQGGNISGKAAYNWGVRLGRPAGFVGGSIEPALGISDIKAPVAGKTDAFRESEWYKGLPEDKVNIIEQAFKDVEKKRKEKK